MVLPLIVATAPFSVDLFLVGSNPAPVADVAWLDPKRAEKDDRFQAALRRTLAPWLTTKRPFVVIDGGDGSLFATAKPWSSVHYLSRAYGGYDSMTETVNGKTRVVEHTSTVGTESGVTVGRNDPKRGGWSQSFLHLGAEPGHPMVALMDLDSYRESLNHGTSQDKQYLPLSILFSDDSTVQTDRYLAETKIQPPGPVLCRTGIPRARDRDVTCFPPAGIVGHYRLVREGTGWRLRFVEFIRAA